MDLEITCTADEVAPLGSTYVKALLFGTEGLDLSKCPRVIWSDELRVYGWTEQALRQCESAGVVVWCFAWKVAA